MTPKWRAFVRRSRGREWSDRQHMVVWVRLDLGAGPEWVVVGRVKS